MYIACVVLATFLSLTSYLPQIKSQHWLIRDLDFPRLQVLTLNLILLSYFIFVADFDSVNAIVIVVILIAVALDFYRIHLYLPGFPKSVTKVDGPPQLTVISANVLTKNRNYQKTIELVHSQNPDLVLLIEVDKEWCEAMAPLQKKYPYSIVQPQENTYGLLLLSKFKLKNPEVMYRIDEAVPSIKTLIVDDKWGEIQLYGIHPRPPRPSEAHSTQRDAELMTVADEIAKEDSVPSIVLGDLNDVAWSHTTRLFLRTSGLLDPRFGRGIFNTFPSFLPVLGFPLDHIFISSSFRLVKLEVLPSIDSDHRPIMIQLILSDEKESKEKATKDDEQEKKEAIEKGEEDYGGPFSEVNPEE